MEKTFRTRAEQAFTLIEILVVIGIIAILASLVLAAAKSVQNKGKRSRAEGEIAAIAAALESYKADNGDYPTNTDTYANPVNNTNLVIALMPTTNGIFATGNKGKVYFEFKANLLANGGTPSKYGYTDPFGKVYGYYYNGSSSNNGTNNYDLWSTAGDTNGNTNTWIKNW